MADKMELAKSKVSEAMEATRTKVSETWAGIAATVSEKVDAVLGFINKLWTAIADIGGKIVGGIMGAIGGIGGGGEMEMPDIEGGPMEWARALQETFVAMKEAVVTNLTAMSESYVTITAVITETHLAWLATMMVNLMTHQLNELTLTQTHLLTTGNPNIHADNLGNVAGALHSAHDQHVGDCDIIVDSYRCCGCLAHGSDERQSYRYLR